MPTPTISAFVVGMVTAVGLPVLSVSTVAAELVPLARHHHRASWCGACECLYVSYVYHRELRTTYGTGFDPRNFDQTQPYYYFGPVRAYPRYWVNAEPVQCGGAARSVATSGAFARGFRYASVPSAIDRK
jgi:hypothetical protein